jgi:hypothetical protein
MKPPFFFKLPAEEQTIIRSWSLRLGAIYLTIALLVVAGLVATRSPPISSREDTVAKSKSDDPPALPTSRGSLFTEQTTVNCEAARSCAGRQTSVVGGLK